ncbi:MAG: hypothetical protein DSZ32_00855 [Gammaproteobacteria bacterium]|nr:MAG: hypothetical protein DSZ32_00855 [Gammaproteobacteria bacterium]
MSLFQRITATFTAGVDKAVSKIENHDALVEASVRQIRHNVAECKVRLARVQRENARVQEKLLELRDADSRWSARARKLGADEREKALACLKRSKACRAQIRHYTGHAEQQQVLEREMAAQLEQMQARLDEIRLTQSRMRSRGASAEVQRVAQQLTVTGADSLDDVFERWEIKLTEAEIRNGVTVDEFDLRDPLESEFVAVEEQAELNAELDALLEGEGAENGQG